MAVREQDILATLASGPKLATEIARGLGLRNAHALGNYLASLERRGFITKAGPRGSYLWRLV